jgi:hypothetical protein
MNTAIRSILMCSKTSSISHTLKSPASFAIPALRMAQDTVDFAPHQCWFCPQGNLSRRLICEFCKGATVPTRSKNEEILKWNIISFDSDSQTMPFSAARRLFCTQHGVVIRFDDQHVRYMLVRHSQELVLFSVKKTLGTVTTLKWKAENKDGISLIDFVRGNLASDGTYLGSW